MKDSSKKSNILTIKDLQQVKSDLLTSEEELREQYKQIIFDLTHDLNDRTTKDGEIISGFYYSCPFSNLWENGEYIYIKELRDVFGLELRSYYGVYYYAFSEGVIMARYGVQPVRLLGVTRSVDRQTVYIGTYRSKILYFYESNTASDFITYQKQEREKQQAREYTALVKVANRVKNYTLQVLNQYAGKQYGEKTKDAIYKQINAYIKSIGGDRCGAYISLYGSHTLNIYSNNGLNNKDIKYYFNIVNENNTILSQDPENVPSKPERDAVQEWEKCEKLRPEIRKKAAELYALIHEYNEHAQTINRDTISSYNTSISSLTY